MNKTCVLKILERQPDGTFKPIYQQFRYGLSETFSMVRTTDTLDWVHKFSGNELKLLLLLLEYEDKNTGVVTLGSVSRRKLREGFGKSARYIQEIMQYLEMKRGFVRITKTELMINPMYLYKGSSGNFVKKMDEFAEQELKNRQKK